MKEIKKTTAANPTQQQRLEYWQEFNDYVSQNMTQKKFAERTGINQEDIANKTEF